MNETGSQVTQGRTYGDPSAFAFGAFAFVLWMASMIQAGWFEAADHNAAVVLSFTLAGVGILICGIMEFLRRDSFRTVMFLFFGFGWLSYAVYQTWFGLKMTGGYDGFFMLGWTIIILLLWVASLQMKNFLLQLFLLGLWITFALWTIGAWGVAILGMIGGYVGLATGILGFIVFIMELLGASKAEKAAGAST